MESCCVFGLVGTMSEGARSLLGARKSRRWKTTWAFLCLLCVLFLLSTVRYFISAKGQHPSLKHTGETFLHAAGAQLRYLCVGSAGPSRGRCDGDCSHQVGVRGLRRAAYLWAPSCLWQSEELLCWITVHSVNWETIIRLPSASHYSSCLRAPWHIW